MSSVPVRIEKQQAKAKWSSSIKIDIEYKYGKKIPENGVIK